MKRVHPIDAAVAFFIFACGVGVMRITKIMTAD